MTREEQDKRMAEIDGWSPGDLMLHIVLLEGALLEIAEVADTAFADAKSSCRSEIKAIALAARQALTD